MPLLVTSAVASTTSMHAAATRTSAAPADSFSSVLDGTHDVSHAAAKRFTQSPTSTTADRGSRHRSSNDRRTPSTSSPKQLSSATLVSPLLAPPPAPALTSSLSPSVSLSQATDTGSQSTAFEAVVSDAASAANSSSLASSPATATTAADPVPGSSNFVAQAPDDQASDAGDGNPGELPSASDTPAALDPAKPAHAKAEPSPASSDDVTEPSANTASSLSLASSQAASVGSTSASLRDLLVGTDRAAGADADHPSAPSLDTRRPATASPSSTQTSARPITRPQAGLSATVSALPASPAPPLPSPPSDPTHSVSLSPAKRSTSSPDKTSATQASDAPDASSLDTTPLSPATPLPAIAFNPAAATAVASSSLPPSPPTSTPLGPGSATNGDAALSTLSGATATDPAAALSKVDVARLVRSASGSELRVALRSDDFGNLTIHATLGRDQLSAHISTESERLGSALSSHLSSMQDTLNDRLGKGVALRTTVSVGSEASSANPGGGRGEAGQQSSSRNSSQTATSSSHGGNGSGRQQPHPSFPVVAGNSAAAASTTNAYSLVSPDRLSIRV